MIWYPVITCLVFRARRRPDTLGRETTTEVLIELRGRCSVPLIMRDGHVLATWFTAMFLHADVPHIVFNGLGLLLFGSLR